MIAMDAHSADAKEVLGDHENHGPCSGNEENLGSGYAAMLNHGGITAIVESEGVVTVGDRVAAIAAHGAKIKV